MREFIDSFKTLLPDSHGNDRIEVCKVDRRRNPCQQPLHTTVHYHPLFRNYYHFIYRLCLACSMTFAAFRLLTQVQKKQHNHLRPMEQRLSLVCLINGCLLLSCPSHTHAIWLPGRYLRHKVLSINLTRKLDITREKLFYYSNFAGLIWKYRGK